METNKIPYTFKMLHHIFGYNINLALDYIQLLVQHPTQKLPVLLLKSKSIAQPAGLSTFTNWLSALMDDNAYICETSLDLGNPFNSAWAEKSLIVIDAVLVGGPTLNTVIAFNNVTRLTVNEKRKPAREVDFNGRFIITCNDITYLAFKEAEHPYVWVKTVPGLEYMHPQFISFIVAEIPNFIKLLNEREIANPQKSSVWFENALLTPSTQK